MTRNSLRIGIDVGGTFTDGVLLDGLFSWSIKTPSTHDNVAIGIVEACRLLAEQRGESIDDLLSEVTHFGLGTTVVTNVITSRTGLRVGLLTTGGFEEMVARIRGDLVQVDGWLTTAPSLVAPECIVGIDERIDASGVVLRAVDIEAAVSAARRLVADNGVEALAVSFLWSVVNPTHEIAVVNAIRSELPGVTVTSGSDLLPVMREHERTMLAVLNAYVGRSFENIANLASTLHELGLRAPVLLVHSNGGSVSTDEARVRPIWLAESGPAAGVAASALLARQAGRANVLTCDMGGTSFDISDITGGEPHRVRRGNLMGVFTALPRIDVESIGAGGGSIAWSDRRGVLRVGPRSAGSEPGPACYGRGGVDPTVTDALVTLGYIDPERFLGGRMRLQPQLARSACERLGAELGLDARETAWGIRAVALAETAKAARGRLAMRGLGPATYTLMSYGGCGSLFAAEIARAIGAPRVLVPRAASVLSALGAAASEVRRERQTPVLQRFPVANDLADKLGGELRDRVEQDLLADGVPSGSWGIDLEADVRYGGQRSELTIPVAAGTRLDDTSFGEDFRREYVTRYGAGSVPRNATLELVALRAVGTGRTWTEPTIGLGSGSDERAHEAPPRTRSVAVSRSGPDDTIPLYDESDGAFPPGRRAGPLLIARRDTTVWIPEGAVVEALADNTLEILCP